MHRAIQPLLPGGRRVVGTAVTLAIAGPDSTLLHHAAGLLRPGDILVVDRLVTTSMRAGAAASPWRSRRRRRCRHRRWPRTDLAEIIASDFPIWARGLAPITTRIYDLGGGMNVPVSCGGAVVMPGDAILADESGVLVIPRDEALAVAEQALTMQERGREREASVRDGRALLGVLSGASVKVRANLTKR